MQLHPPINLPNVYDVKIHDGTTQLSTDNTPDFQKNFTSTL